MELLINETPKTNPRQAIKKSDVSCPACHNSSCDRIPRAKIVKVLFFWLDMKRYKCYQCRHKFYVMNSHKKEVANLLSE